MNDLNPSALVPVVRSSTSGAVIVAGDPSSCLLWARAAADELVAASLVAESDVRFCEPASDRWSVAEIASKVRAPTSLVPQMGCWFVVMSDAAAAAPAALSQLLKTLEEPQAPTWFLLCVDSDESFDAPIEGRAALRVRCDGSGRSPLLVAAEKASVLDELEALFELPRPRPGQSMHAARQWSMDARAVAERLRPAPAGPWMRRLVGDVLDRSEAHLEVMLRSGADPGAVDEVLRTVAAARRQLTLFTPPEAVVAAVLAAFAGLHTGL